MPTPTKGARVGGSPLPRLARPPVAALPRLALHEQLVDVLGLEQARQPQELLLLGRSGHGQLPELLAVVQHAVEVGDRAEGLIAELLLQLVGRLLLALGLGQQRGHRAARRG